jgi:hypothetical protein
MKKKGTMLFDGKLMEVEIIMLSEISKTNSTFSLIVGARENKQE